MRHLLTGLPKATSIATRFRRAPPHAAAIRPQHGSRAAPAWQLSGRQDTHASRCTHVFRRLPPLCGSALAPRREAKLLPPHGRPRRAPRGQHVLAALVAGAHQQRHARYSGGAACAFLPSPRPPRNLSLASFHAPRSSRRAETGDTFKTRGVNMKPISNGNPPGTSGPVLSTSLFLACGRRGRPVAASRQSRQVKDPKQAARAARHVLPLYYRCRACMSMLIPV